MNLLAYIRFSMRKSLYFCLMADRETTVSHIPDASRCSHIEIDGILAFLQRIICFGYGRFGRPYLNNWFMTQTVHDFNRTNRKSNRDCVLPTNAGMTEMTISYEAGISQSLI